MVIVQTDKIFTTHHATPHRGFYLNGWLKPNIDNYMIKAVDNKWDCVILITGMEGSGKTTATMAIARYIDPTFPGPKYDKEEWSKRKNNEGVWAWRRRLKLWNDEWRHCDRIVFTFDQFMKAIDTAKPKQAVVFDEAVTAMNAQDSASEMQKILIKKMTMIRKKRLFIFIIIPNIFMLRKYFAIARTRALIHFFSPDGISRGRFKFFNYNNKRKLYFRGYKMWDMNAAKPSFIGSSVDTSNYFFPEEEYEAKKDAAIKELTEAPAKKKKAETEKARWERERWTVWVYEKKLKFDRLFYRKYPDKSPTVKLFVRWVEQVYPYDCFKDYSVNMWSKWINAGRKLVTGSDPIGAVSDR